MFLSCSSMIIRMIGNLPNAQFATELLMLRLSRSKRGADFSRALIESAHQNGSIPAASLTALARSEDRQRALLAGFDTHLAKPVDPNELVALVASLVFRSRRGTK